ncbi:MAG: alpha/beta fold hydrolase [Pseudomonadota bacterium]
MPSRFIPCALALLLGVAFGARAQPTATPPLPAVASFFASPAMNGAQLSPDGKRLAIRMAGKNGRIELAVIDLASKASTIAGYFLDADVGNVRWVNDARLVFDTADHQRGLGVKRYAPGLFAVDADGKNYRQLVSRSGLAPQAHTARQVLPANTLLLGDMGTQDSVFIYVQQVRLDRASGTNYVDLLRLNTLTGGTESVAAPAPVQHWLLDQKGEPRIALGIEEDTEVVWYRDPAKDQWRKLTEFKRYGGVSASFVPLRFGPDGTLYVRANHGADKAALYTYDLAANKLADKPLVQMADYDFQGVLVTDQHRLLGVHYEIDADASVWFDPAMAALQKRVDALLPQTINTLAVAPRAQSPYVLVTSHSDLQPLRFALFNKETGTLSPIGERRPDIRADQMSNMEMVHYAARDGLSVPAYLTLPYGKPAKNLPLVVLVHGGPFGRDVWGWNAAAQLFASRGYAVLEPQYRGSTGFGERFTKAGFKQLGLGMQNDIADGAKWAIAQGTADAKRVCIVGEGFGGYAALMGLAKDPALYKCGVDFGGLTDFKLLLNGHWTIDSVLPEEWKRYGVPALLGDPDKDAAQLIETSPLTHAAQIKQPLLMGHGGADSYIGVLHAKRFAEAAANPKLELVVYDDEGHTLELEKNRVDFWSRVDKFLGQQLGQP